MAASLICMQDWDGRPGCATERVENGDFPCRRPVARARGQPWWALPARGVLIRPIRGLGWPARVRCHIAGRNMETIHAPSHPPARGFCGGASRAGILLSSVRGALMIWACLQCGREFEAKRSERLCSDGCRQEQRKKLARVWWIMNRERIRAREEAGRKLRK